MSVSHTDAAWRGQELGKTAPELFMLPVLGKQGFFNVACWNWQGPPGAPTVVCVHGLTRNGRDFDVLAAALSKDFRVVCPDMPGRGKSDWLSDHSEYGLPLYVSVMAALYARLGVAQIDWVGTSMGGLIGMLFSTLPNNPVRRLVLNDIGPHVPVEALRRIVEYVGRTRTFGTMAQLENYLRTIHAPFGPLSDEQWQHLATHSARETDGNLTLAYDPNIVASVSNGAAVRPVELWATYNAISCPVLVLRGETSDVLLAEDAEKMTGCGPCARLVQFGGVGHAPALMAEEQIKTVGGFLSDHR